MKNKVTIFRAYEVANEGSEGFWTPNKAKAIKRAEELYSNLDPCCQVDVDEYLCSQEELTSWLCEIANADFSAYPTLTFDEVTDHRDTPTVWSSFDTDRHKEWMDS